VLPPVLPLVIGRFPTLNGGFFTPRLSSRRGRLAGVCVDGMGPPGFGGCFFGCFVLGVFFFASPGHGGWNVHLALGKDDGVSSAGETRGP